MALQVWLPLNGNLNNQGLTNVTVTNNGATVDNNGKIGKCYSFGTSTSYLTLSNDTMNTCTTECTLAFWINITSWNTTYATYFQAGLGSTAWTHYIFGVLRNNTASNLCFTISNGSSSSTNSYTTPNLELNTWYHLTFVYKTGHCLIYVNGSLYQDYTTSYVPAFSSITKTTVGMCNSGVNYQTNCKMNDLRVYNRALAPKEIEILSRGLVAHYPLNNNGGGQPNLYDFESVANKWAVEGLTLANATDEVYGNVLKITSPSSVSSQRIYRTVSNVWKADTKFTVSFLAKASKTAVVKMSRSLANYAPDVTVGTAWKRYSTVITCSTTVEGGTLSIQTSTASADIYITQIKLELGDKATVYCPGVGDSHYIPLGYNSTTEYDVSGYGYNGTKTNITYSNNSARYSTSSAFNGSSSRIYVPNFSIGNEWSYGCWLRCNSLSGNWQAVAILNNTGGDADIQLGCYAYPTNSVFQSSANGKYNSGIACPHDTNWHYFFATYDGASLKTYVDGTLVATNSVTAALLARTNLTIGARCSGSGGSSFSNYFNGDLSDFRIYATALSATQVAELYNTAVSVANNGTLMGYELVEG